MSDTFITPAALASLRDDLDVFRKKLMEFEEKVRHLDEKVRHLDGVDLTLNEHDDRLDDHDRRHAAAETTLREMGSAIKKLVNGVSSRDLAMERIERHCLAMMAHMKIAPGIVVSAVAAVAPPVVSFPLPAFKDDSKP